MVDKVTIGKADLQQRDRKITEQQRKLDAQDSTIKDLIERLETVEKSGTPPQKSTKVSASFNKEDGDLLGELAEPIQRLISDGLQGVTNALSPQLEGLAKSMTTLQSQVTDQNKNLFSGVATSALKNYKDIKDSEEFKELLETRVPGTNITYGDTWSDAEERNDIDNMQEIVNMVKLEEVDDDDEPAEEDGTTFEPKGNAPDIANSSGRYIYKASDLAAEVEKFKVGSITADDMDMFEEKFNKAVDEGKVLDDRDPNNTD